MSERKIWKPEEDLILRELFERRRIHKWSEISKLMEKQGFEGRNGKQCRQRYHNHLKDGIRKEKWTLQEEKELVRLHALYGNRWAQISKLIPGRTQNCVKNMLYSKLRKSIRRLNRFSYEHYRKSLKQIKISFIYRLIDFTELYYRKEGGDRNQQEIMALGLKDKILMLDLEQGTPLDQQTKEGIRKLAEDIHTFKRVNQRFRAGHALRFGKRGKAKKLENEFDEELQQDQSENEEREGSHQDSHQREGEKLDMLLKQKQPSAKIKQEQMQASTNIREQAIKEAPTLQIIEGAPHGIRQKISILRMDSLQSNLFLMDAGLEKPIRTENQFLNLTPTPPYTGVAEDWGGLSSSQWRNNFVFE